MSEFVNTLDKLGDVVLTDSILNKTIEEFYDDTIDKLKYAAFRKCKKLKVVNCPNVKTIETIAFMGCSAIETVNFPSAEIIQGNAFNDTSTLRSLSFPRLKTASAYAFSACFNLNYLDLGSITSAGNNCFEQTKLTAVILRGTTVCSLGTNAFNGSSNILGKTGYIYVPRALVSSYKTATNWSEFATQFRALEDYTVDGTITGELDETKI